MASKILKAVGWRYRDFLFNLKVLTFFSLIKYYTALLLGKRFITIAIKGIKRKFLIRVNNRIDRNVLEYVFFKQYHLPPKEYILKNNATIVDLGSNIGSTIVDFKIRYPQAIVYGYEMHSENYEIAKANCKGLNSVFIYNKAVWIDKGFVLFNKKNVTDAFAIDKNAKDGNEVIKISSLSINDIIADNHLSTIDYLKMDIEGAEVEIFNSPDLSWLSHVSSMNVEFHNIPDSQVDYYKKLLETYNFKVYRPLNQWFSILAYKNNF